MQPNNSQIIIYRNESGDVKLDVRLDGDTVWLTQKMMAELFDVTTANVNIHLKNVFDTEELSKNRTIKEFLIVQKEGDRDVSRKIECYNLDAIISVGYRVNSSRATQFRIWATKTLKEYIIKGFVLDDERLKNPDQPFDYFEELTRRIQDIRTSEKRFYRKITDIYALSVDYDPTDEMSIQFFKTVQNKMHWAITGKTAAEIVKTRADSKKPNMGLTNWRGDIPRKDDVAIAKNYLDENELSALNNLVEQYLVFAEGQAMRRIPMHMKDWIEKLHGFLQLNDRDILNHVGKVSHDLAKEFAESEYNKFHEQQLKLKADLDSDFEKAIVSIEEKKSHQKLKAKKK
ncbi:MAG: hydroxyacid dehydrogenase [Gammaproteobacteria bacterium RIFCSPHIGHO2_12_FULL_38_14]|nr:MAG: hydroxyacid dehydrogenase [Gammaproteobacteria bacterium RIFCSPHIGHO2_12_FULL_38_14]